MAAESGVLRWVQPKWNQRRYELRDANDATVATLDYSGKRRARPVFCFEGEELEFQRRGFLKANVAIVRGEQEIASYTPKATRADITFVSGRKFTLKRRKIFSSEHVISASDNEEIMALKRTPRFLRAECTVTLSPSAYKYPETRVLMALTWYQMLAAAQAAVTAAS
jgi:hypothetical protein